MKRYQARQSSSNDVYSVFDTRWETPVRLYHFDKELAEYICDYLNRRDDAKAKSKEKSQDKSAPSRPTQDNPTN
jgi:hypothetical protein